jgi:hypothetical protein
MVGLRKRAFLLVATFAGIALERFDALTRDNRNMRIAAIHASYSIRCHRIRSARKRACTAPNKAERAVSAGDPKDDAGEVLGNHKRQSQQSRLDLRVLPSAAVAGSIASARDDLFSTIQAVSEHTRGSRDFLCRTDRRRPPVLLAPLAFFPTKGSRKEAQELQFSVLRIHPNAAVVQHSHQSSQLFTQALG